jgi:hypothetical protein
MLSAGHMQGTTGNMQLCYIVRRACRRHWCSDLSVAASNIALADKDKGKGTKLQPLQRQRTATPPHMQYAEGSHPVCNGGGGACTTQRLQTCPIAMQLLTCN